MSLTILNMPERLFGPVLLKEVLVSSRRRRFYLLRMLYLLVLVGFLAIVWLGDVGSDFSLWSRAQMAEAGRLILGSMNWFQYIALQVLAVLLCCGGVGDEARKRTLPVLLSTPVSNFKIVLGKLMSCLLQLLVLLAINLPFLAMVRMLGGVPIGSVLAVLFITMLSALMIGALTLRLSITARTQLGAMFMGFCVLGLHFLATTFFFVFEYKWFHHPVALMDVLDNGLRMGFAGPGGRQQAALLDYVLAAGPYCLMLLLVTVVSLRSAAALRRRVRKDASLLWSAGSGRPRRPSRPISPPLAPAAAAAASPAQAAASPQAPARHRHRAADDDPTINRVVGWPLVWKELLFFAPRRRGQTVLAILATVAVLSIIYMSMAASGLLAELHTVYLWIYLVLAIAVGVGASATCVASEKQSRTLAILLTTPMSDWQIIVGKIVGVAKRCMVPWLLAVAHVVGFAAAGMLRLRAASEFLLMLAWLSIFIMALGLYLSSQFQSPSWSLVAMIMILAMLWIIAPMILGIPSDHSRQFRQWHNWCVDANPFYQAYAALWTPTGRDGPPDILKPLLTSTAAYAAISGIMLLRAKACLRKDLF